MPTFKIKLTGKGFFSPESMRRRKEAMALVLLRQTQERILAGGDEEYTFPPLDFPRKDGSTNQPLLGNRTIYESLYATADSDRFGVKSRFIGARIQQEGTVGKGGKLRTIRPKRAKVLAFQGPGGRIIFARKVDIRPRHYLRLTQGDKAELVQTFANPQQV